MISQYRKENDYKFSVWLRKMNDLDLHNRTRTFFVEIRKRHKVNDEIGPIRNRDGTLSENVSDTLKNWSEFYQNLYCEDAPPRKPSVVQTPDEDPSLDKDLTLSEFVDIIYSLKHHKSPGLDSILNEDITSVILEGDEDNPIPPSLTKTMLNAIFKILSEFWFNESVPRDFQRTLLKPVLKNREAEKYDPSNYRPISLLNTLMKIYEGIICKRLISYIEEKRILSPYQAAYRKGKSTSDHILVLQELFL